MILFSPTTSAIILNFIFDNSISLSSKPKTTIRFMKKKLRSYISLAIYDKEIIEDSFDDLLDILDYLHLCHYNICLIIYISLLLYLIVHYSKYGKLDLQLRH